MMRSCWGLGRFAMAVTIAICSVTADAPAQRTSDPRADSARAAAAKDTSMKDTSAMDMSGMMDMPGMQRGSAMAMPIPMPKDMPMPPSFMGLVPPVGIFLPGAGVDPATLPMVKPSEVVRMKDGDTLDEPLRGNDGFFVVTLKEHKVASREEFDKDKDTYEQTLLAAKQAEALALYVRRLRDESKGEIKIDESYLSDGKSNKDGGAPASTDDDDEGN